MRDYHKHVIEIDRLPGGVHRSMLRPAQPLTPYAIGGK
jgi:hypothetical protein